MPSNLPNRIASAAIAFMMAPLCLGASACRQTVYLTPSGDMDASNGDDGGALVDRGAFCIQLFGTFRSPDIILMIDRSDVMQVPLGGTTRMLAVEAALQGLVSQYQTSVRFGYGEFPSSMPVSCGPGGGDTCCAGDVSLPTPSSLTTFPQYIHSCNVPCLSPQRPTADALAECRQRYMDDNTGGRNNNRYVLLVTGGEPNCGGDSTPGGACAAAANEAAKLNNAYIKTYVVVVNNELTSSDCLDKLASQGGEPRGNQSPRYYLASAQTDLNSELSTIVGGIAKEACHIDIIQQFPGPGTDTDKLSVYINGKPINHDPVNGWDLDNGSTFRITLFGDACDSVLSGQVPLQPQSIQIFSGRGCPQ